MFKKYKNSILLFLFLEKAPIVYWTNKVLPANHSVIYITKRWSYLLIQIMKYECLTSSNFLIENSAIDTANYSLGNFNTNVTNSFNKVILFYTFQYINLKTKLTLFIGNNNFLNLNFISIDKLYSNANWAERETSEMYNAYFLFKNDTRRLLLDYSKTENPMLKNYPCEGYNDVFYSIFENQVISKSSEVVEL